MVKIEFKPEIYKFNFDDETPHTTSMQQQIFDKMAEFISQFLNLEKPLLVKIILFLARKWEGAGSTPFGYLQRASPQERLQMAVVFSDELTKLLTKFLLDSNDELNLKNTAEKSVQYYMDNFATRD